MITTLVLLPRKSNGQRSLVDYSPWGHKKSDMTEWLTWHTEFAYLTLSNNSNSDARWLIRLLISVSHHTFHFIYFYFFIIILFIYFFYFKILYWFCHTSTCICHRCTRVPHPEPPSHLPPHTIPHFKSIDRFVNSQKYGVIFLTRFRKRGY